jgi:glycosyltransferase involved in cell wall biosynthesis
MRIGLDARWYNDSGVGTYILGLVRAFASIDGDHEIVAFENPEHPVPVTETPRLRKVIARAGRYSIREQFELAALSRREKVDLFHAPFYVAPRWTGVPLVATLHDMAAFHFPLYGPLKSMIVKAGYRDAARRADAIITPSNYSAADIRRTLHVPEERIYTVLHGVVSDEFSPESSARDEQVLATRGIRRPYVMMLGARNWKTKNLDTGLRVLAQCRAREGLRFQAVLAGPDDVLRSHSVDESVRHLDLLATGFVATEELAALYRNAEVFLLPSRFEGFGYPLIEAMACGCAVVSSTGGSLAEVAGNGAITADPDDEEQMSRAISMLLTDSDQREKWKARALERSREFSNERAARETLDVYRKVLSQTFERGRG